MLNKEVCWACRKKHGNYNRNNAYLLKVYREDFDKDWDTRCIVNCTARPPGYGPYSSFDIGICCKPPEGCPYVLEHAIVQ